MAKYRMGTAEADGKQLTCSLGTVWPPMAVIAYGPTAVDARDHVDEAEYERLRTWERVCGLREMDAAKCASCPYVNIDGKLAVQPGTKTHRPYATRFKR